MIVRKRGGFSTFVLRGPAPHPEVRAECASQEGWALEVVRPPKHLMTIFQISGMDDHLQFVEGQGRDVAT